MLDGGQFISINLTRYNDAGQFSGFEVIATANRRETFATTGLALELNLDELGALKVLLEGAAHVTVDNVRDANVVHPKLGDWLSQFGIQSLSSIPLRAMGDSFGFIGVNGTAGPLYLSQIELQAYQNIADQVAVFARMHRMTEAAAYSDSLNERLTQVFNELVVRQNFAEMAHSIARHMLPEQGRYLAINRLEYDDAGNITSWRVLASANRNRAFEVDDQGGLVVAWDAINEDLRRTLLENQPYFLNDIKKAIETAGEAAYQWLSDSKIQAVLTVPMTVEGRPIATLNIMSRTHHPFTKEEVLAFQQLASQMAALVQARSLLEDAQRFDAQARSARQTAGDLVEANRRTATQLENQVMALRTINELAASISRAQDEQALLNQTAQSIVNVLNVDHVLVAMADAGGKTATVVSEHPLRGVAGAKLDLQTDELQRKVRDERRPLLVSNVSEDETLKSTSRRLLMDMNISSVLLTPLLDVQGNFIGSIRLDSYTTEKSFTPDMIDVVQAIAAQVTASLQNIRLLRDAQRRAEQLQYIAAFSQSVQATLDEKVIFEVAMTETTRMIPLDYMGIMMYDSAYGHLELVAQYEEGKSWVTDADGPIVSRENTTAGRVWDTRALLHTPDLSEETGLRHPLKKDLRSLVVVPITSRGYMLGMAETGSFSAHVYNNTDIAVFQQMVNQLAIALENAEAYSQSQQLAKTKALANEIAAQLQQQMDMDNILTVTMNQLGRALGAKRGRIRLGTKPNGQ
jgi:GAF domain-containing protein